MTSTISWFETDTGSMLVRTGTDSMGTVFVAAHPRPDGVDDRVTRRRRPEVLLDPVTVRGQPSPSERATATSATASRSPGSSERRQATTPTHTSTASSSMPAVEPGGPVRLDQHQHVDGRQRGEDARTDESEVLVHDRRQPVEAGQQQGHGARRVGDRGHEQREGDQLDAHRASPVAGRGRCRRRSRPLARDGSARPGPPARPRGCPPMAARRAPPPRPRRSGDRGDQRPSIDDERHRQTRHGRREHHVQAQRGRAPAAAPPKSMPTMVATTQGTDVRRPRWRTSACRAGPAPGTPAGRARTPRRSGRAPMPRARAVTGPRTRARARRRTAGAAR